MNNTNQNQKETQDQSPEALDPAREQLLDELTGELIDKMEQGERPQFAQYATRYPELAQVLKTRLADYWLEDRQVIRELQEERTAPEYIARLSVKVADPDEKARVNTMVAQIVAQVAAERRETPAVPITASTETAPPISNLYQLAIAKGINRNELARQVGVGTDIMTKLNSRAFRWVGLPRELLKRLAQTLDVSIAQLQTYLSGLPSMTGVAYHLSTDKPQASQQQDFARAVRESDKLTDAERSFWLAEIEQNSYREGEVD